MKSARTIHREINQINSMMKIRLIQDKPVENLRAARLALEWALGLFADCRPSKVFSEPKEYDLMRDLTR